MQQESAGYLWEKQNTYSLIRFWHIPFAPFFLILEHSDITPYLNKTLLVHIYGVWEYVFSISVKTNEIHNTSCWFSVCIVLRKLLPFIFTKGVICFSGIIISKWWYYLCIFSRTYILYYIIYSIVFCWYIGFSLSSDFVTDTY